MADLDLLDEIDDLKEKLDETQQALAQLKEERDNQVADLEEKVTRIKEDVEDDWRERLKNLDRDYREKMESLNLELDKLRMAFSGDFGGWEEKKTKAGNVYYENSETGETTNDEPEVFFIARAMQRIEEADAMMAEFKTLKSKFKDLELKKREADLLVNKTRTEMNSLRSMDRLWKDSAKSVYLNLSNTANIFESQTNQVLQGLSGLSKCGDRMNRKLPLFAASKKYIADAQEKMKTQEQVIASLNLKVKELTADCAEKQAKITLLSAGIEEEVLRLTHPIREKLAETMSLLMKEKAARSQERRELADLWPSGHMMPTILLKSRALSLEEKDRRIKATLQKNANLALSIEIRSNVAESKLWELKYDDYGRAFYQHSKTGQTLWEQPEIMNYTPPPGRDELGNIIESEEEDLSLWKMRSDHKGEIFWVHDESKEVRYESPLAYPKLPKGRNTIDIVTESAKIVLNFLRKRIGVHIRKMKAIKERCENPLTPDEIKKKEKEEKSKAQFGGDPSSGGVKDELDGDGDIFPGEDLSLYQYDIETVEMLAYQFDESTKRSKDMDPALVRNDRRDFLKDAEVRGFDAGVYAGPCLYETDVKIMNVNQLRGVVEHLAICEEKLEARIEKTRENLKDFSEVLLERLREAEIELQEKKRQEFFAKQEERKQRRLAEKPVRRSHRFKRERDMDTESIDQDEGFNSPLSPMTTGDDLGLRINDDNTIDENSLDGSPRKKLKVDMDGEIVESSSIKEKLDEDLENNDENIEDGIKDDEEQPPPAPEDDIEIHTIASELTGADEYFSDSEYDPASILLGEPEILPTDPLYSEEILQISKKLINFSLFCGFTNLRMEKAISDPLLEFDMSSSFSTSSRNQDDHWLTASFFLNITKDRVDALHELTSLKYDPALGLLNVTHLDSYRLRQEGFFRDDSWNATDVVTAEEDSSKKKFIVGGVEMKNEHRSIDEPWLPAVRAINESWTISRALWKARQLMGQVLKFQFQQEAIEASRKSRLQDIELPHIGTSHGRRVSFISSNSRAPLKKSRPVKLCVNRIVLSRISTRMWHERQRQYFQISLGKWTINTSSLVVTGQNLIWEEEALKISALVTLNEIHLEDLKVEVFEENFFMKSKWVAIGSANLSILLGANTNHEVDIPISLANKDGVELGTAVITLLADDRPLEQSKIDESCYDLQDPHDLRNREILEGKFRYSEYKIPLMKSQGMFLDSNGVENDALSGTFPSLADQMSNFTTLIEDLRGDGDEVIRQMIGDVGCSEILARGHRISPAVVRALPDFAMAKAFMRRRALMHAREREFCIKEIDRLCNLIQDDLEKKFSSSQSTVSQAKSKYKSLMDQIENAKNEVDRIVGNLNEIRDPRPKPKVPVFEEFPELPLVNRLPPQGGLDSRGKKKRQIPNKQLNTILQDVEKGNWDAKEWDFGDFWPSASQQTKLEKAINQRNNVHEAKRAKEIKEREKAMELHGIDVEKWEADEKVRKRQCDKIRKELRKANLKLSSCVDRSERYAKEFEAIERDASTFQSLKEFHEKSRERFRMMELKHMLEHQRQEKTLERLKKKFLKAIESRKRALDMPQAAVSELQFDKMSRQAEEALRFLTLEIFQIREELYSEGVRLRTLFNEEITLLRHEKNRCQMLSDIVQQRLAIDQIILRHRYESLHLMESMEKLRLIEAERDEQGKDTVDDLGERYSPTKQWDSPEIQSCQRLLDLVLAKIVLIESVTITASSSQASLLESMSSRWGVDFTPVRDSWVENSDYERSERLLQEICAWVALQRRKLMEKERMQGEEVEELGLQLSAMKEINIVAQESHEYENQQVTDSASDMVTILQSQLQSLRDSSKETQERMENSIIDLSRECQQVREELISQRLYFEDKTKVLFAIVGTLQSTLQHMTSKMEVFLEERDKIVIASKLEADKLRNQLRQERRHCSNMLFILHSQRGTIKYYRDVLALVRKQAHRHEMERKKEKTTLRQQIWEQVFTFTRLATDIDGLFEFFVGRLANLAGARKSFNEALANNGAASVLGALCHSPRPLIRKLAARAIGGMGWDGYVETRILIWDAMMYWKVYRSMVLAKEQEAFTNSLEKFAIDGNPEAILILNESPFSDGTSEFVPSKNISLRTLIKQRRQWALRTTRRAEGPNFPNQRLLNIRDGVIPALLKLCDSDGDIDREIPRNAALAISVASYDSENHRDMINDSYCISSLLRMCMCGDEEVQTHAAITLANLCHEDEHAQMILGNSGAIEVLLQMVESPVVDVLESSTAALANLTSDADVNCKRVLENDGVSRMIRLITQSFSENLLDLDQNDEVQANAAEVLANISRFYSETTLPAFTPEVVESLVFLCASRNRQVRRHAPLVVGNIAQNEQCRADFGLKGGIESLFLVLEDEDPVVQANTLWALCNLMWHPPNQERAGRFMPEIVARVDSSHLPIATYACTLLANTLYYHNANRVRFLEIEGAMELVMNHLVQRSDRPIMESCLRAVLSLSYVDFVSEWLGASNQAYLPLFIEFIRPPFFSRDGMKFSLEILSNLCVHHSNRQAILDNGGIEALVYLQSDDDPYLGDLAVQVLQYLEDVTPPEVLARMKAKIGLDRMVLLAQHEDPLVRTVAVESIGEEIWHDSKKQQRANELGGMEVLLDILGSTQGALDTLLPALWSLRNLLYQNLVAQEKFYGRDGVLIIVQLLQRSLRGEFEDQTEKMIEAALAVFVTAIFHHEKNSRRLLMVGLEILMDLADMSYSVSQGGKSSSIMVDPLVAQACRSESIVALSKSILLMLGPYNYVVCKNCFKKQDLHGTSCIHCGNRLKVEVVEKHNLSPLRSKTPHHPSPTIAPSSPIHVAPPRTAGGRVEEGRHSTKQSSEDATMMSSSASMSRLPVVGVRDLQRNRKKASG